MPLHSFSRISPVFTNRASPLHSPVGQFSGCDKYDGYRLFPLVKKKQACLDGFNVLSASNHRGVLLLPHEKLVEAIGHNDCAEAQAALADGVDLAGTRISGKSFLRLAGERGHRSICELLVRFGADPNEKNGARRFSLLHNAVSSSNYGFASILLDLKANPNVQCSSGATPLHFAARTGQGFLATNLLKHGADIDARDRRGQSPLYSAIRKADLAMTELLVNNGCNVNLADRRGLSPLQLASHLNLGEIAEYLRSHGANAQDDYSHSATLSRVAETRTPARPRDR